MQQLQKIPNLCFFFPYHEDSGVPMLFYRMANFLASQHPDVKVYAIDYANGAIARHLIKIPNLILLAFEDGKDIIPPDDAVLVTQSIVPYYWPKELKPKANTKLLMWNLHPQNFVPSLIPFGKHRDFTMHNFSAHKFLGIFFRRFIKQIANYVKVLAAHNALIYMDQTNYDFTHKYLFIGKSSEVFLPVPLTESNKLNQKTKVDPQNINFCWIGRLCDFKVPILIYTAKKLKALTAEMDVNIVYHIVGDGPLMEFAKENMTDDDKFKVVFHGSIPNSHLDDFLLNEIDVVTGMGTSALEGAKLAIPNIKLDISYKPVTADYNYHFIYETVNYDLGHYITGNDVVENNDSLKRIILSIVTVYGAEAQKCYQYFVKNHSMEIVANKFIAIAQQATLDYGMIDQSFFEQPAVLKLMNRFRKVKVKA